MWGPNPQAAVANLTNWINSYNAINQPVYFQPLDPRAQWQYINASNPGLGCYAVSWGNYYPRGLALGGITSASNPPKLTFNYDRSHQVSMEGLGPDAIAKGAVKT